MVREIFDEITPESADILASVVGALTDDIASENGSTKAALSLTTDIITGIGKAKADSGISENETENTIDAMTKIVVTMYGATDINADSAVEIIKSCAKSNTIMSAVEKRQAQVMPIFSDFRPILKKTGKRRKRSFPRLKANFRNMMSKV